MDIWSVPEFRTGLRAGVVAAGLLLLPALVAASWRRGRPLPLAGIAIAAAGLWAIADATDVRGAVVVGVVGVGLAAGIGSLRIIPAWCCAGLALPFGWLLGFRGDLIETTWARVLVAVAASLGGVLVAEFDAAWRRDAIAPGLLALTIVGAYFAVPDTEQVAALVGVVLPIAVLGWPLRMAALGRPGAAAAVATLVWASAIGGEGRPASIIGAVACLGLLAGVPVARALGLRSDTAFRNASRPVVIALLAVAQLGFVVVASRIAGDLSDPLPAAVIAVVIAVGAVVVGSAFPPGRPRARASPGRG